MTEEMKDAAQTDEAVVEEGNTEYQGQALSIEDELTKLRIEMDEYKDRYLRAYAEMDNMKKRLAREKQEIIKYGTEKLLKDMLLIYDAIEKSLMAGMERHPEDEHFIQGLKMTEKLFLETLKKNNVEPIETQNVAFDPRYHDALMQVAAPDMEKGMVVNELEKGFMLHDRVLRPAKVTVSG